MRHPDRWSPDQRRDGLRGGRRGDDRGGEGRPVVQVRKERRNGAGEEGLADAGWPDQEQSVAPGKGDLQRAPCDCLSAHVREIHGRRVAGRGGCRLPRPPSPGARPPLIPEDIRHVSRARQRDRPGPPPPPAIA